MEMSSGQRWGNFGGGVTWTDATHKMMKPVIEKLNIVQVNQSFQVETCTICSE